MIKVTHKELPRLSGVFVKWLNEEEFIVDIAGSELIGHKDYWYFMEE